MRPTGATGMVRYDSSTGTSHFVVSGVNRGSASSHRGRRCSTATWSTAAVKNWHQHKHDFDDHNPAGMSCKAVHGAETFDVLSSATHVLRLTT